MKKACIFIILLLVLFSAHTMTYADIITGEYEPPTQNSATFNSMGSKIVDVAQTVGTLVAVVVIIILGIKYMSGSPAEKAEYKKTLFPYFVGAVLVFATVNIATIIQTLAKNIVSTGP